MFNLNKFNLEYLLYRYQCGKTSDNYPKYIPFKQDALWC